MASYVVRRRADINLWKGCKAISRNRRNPKAMRRAARRARFAFWLRIATRQHGYPSRGTLLLTLGFRYGEYGGVGWGIPAGNVKDPIDKLDKLFLAHDQAYATVEQLEHWHDMQALING